MHTLDHNITNLGAAPAEHRPAAGAVLPDAEDPPPAPAPWPAAGRAGSAVLPPPPGAPPALPAGGPWQPGPGTRTRLTVWRTVLVALKVF